MNSNDITVSMVTNALQKGGKQNKTEKQATGMKGDKLRSVASALWNAF